MKRLTVYRIGTRWFAHAVVTQDDRREFHRVDIPQTEAEIEAFAVREGYTIEWDEPEPPTRRRSG